ncbi:MAG: SprT-like domain-containing protein, partial [Endozoicomonadaceae bacterium]|nr:SprT-like domain-containing protein [Endozoicomonadaceae bacterium]
PERNLLRFNPVFFANGSADYLKQIVAHEVAHLVAFHMYGKCIRPHGKEWTAIMTEIFKLPAIRCHNYDLSSTGRYPYVYTCSCTNKNNFFSVVRHRRACKGTIYICRSCGDKLQYSHQTKPVKTTAHSLSET